MKTKYMSDRYLKFLLYLVVIVLINIAGVSLFKRMDLTLNKSFSLSKVSCDVVKFLSEPLTINVFFTNNLPAPYNNTQMYLRDLLEEYSINGNRYFNYKFYDISSKEDDISNNGTGNRELAEKYGIKPIQIQIVEEDEVKFKIAYMGLVLIHGDIIEKIPAITSINGLEYKITTAIQKLNNKVSALVALKEKIKIKLFYSSSLSQVAPFMGLNKLPELPEKIKTSVEKLNKKLFGKLEFNSYDPSNKEFSEENSNLVTEMKQYNFMTLQWPELSNEEVKGGSGTIGLVLEHGDDIAQIQLLNVIEIPILGTQYQLIDFDSIEDTMSESIESLINVNESIGYLISNGTDNIYSKQQMMGQQEAGLSNFRSLLSQNYTIKTIDLKEENIPESLKTLIIAGPTEPFSEYELFQIDQALMKGTSIAFYLDPFNEVMPSGQNMGFGRGPSYIPIDTGLEKLLSHYGLDTKNAYVLDKSCYKQRMPAQYGGGEKDLYFAPVIKNININHELDIMKNIMKLVTVKSSPIILDKKKVSDNSILATELFSSSNESWEIKDQINLNPMYLHAPKNDDDMHKFALAYMLEGNFPSFFAGKPIPVKEIKDEPKDDQKDDQKDKENSENQADKDEEKENIKTANNTVISNIKTDALHLDKGKKAKLFLITTSEVLKDNVLATNGQSPNTAFIMNITDYLNNHGDIAVMRSKIMNFSPLEEVSGVGKAFIKIINVVGVPVIVIFLGVVVWFRRRIRRKNIEMIFNRLSNKFGRNV